ncbi:hypothetical protein B0H13DRAFT_2441208 [Mycena leptocephala]|nr:hypothetical protein B0H13DRAFT_2441208 [Mycena leptocephala]
MDVLGDGFASKFAVSSSANEKSTVLVTTGQPNIRPRLPTNGRATRPRRVPERHNMTHFALCAEEPSGTYTDRNRARICSNQAVGRIQTVACPNPAMPGNIQTQERPKGARHLLPAVARNDDTEGKQSLDSWKKKVRVYIGPWSKNKPQPINSEQRKNSQMKNLFCASRFDREESMRGGSAASASELLEFSHTGSTGGADGILEPRYEAGSTNSRSIGSSRGRGGQGRHSGRGLASDDPYAKEVWHQEALFRYRL